MFKVGDLQSCKKLDDGEGRLVLDSDDLAIIERNLSLTDLTGAIVYTDDGEYKSVWVTEYSRPFDHAAMYRKVL